MRLDSTLKRRFPELTRLITREIPGCISNPKIFTAFKKFAQLNDGDAILALTHNGHHPTIDVAFIDDYGQYRGEIKKRHLDKVLVQRKLSKEFEKLDPDISWKKPYDLIFTATILHEMVHWGDWKKDGVVQPNKDIYDAGTGTLLKDMDVGFQFEEEAFNAIYTVEYLR